MVRKRAILRCIKFVHNHAKSSVFRPLPKSIMTYFLYHLPKESYQGDTLMFNTMIGNKHTKYETEKRQVLKRNLLEVKPSIEKFCGLSKKSIITFLYISRVPF